jgi:hypothetical protein
MPGARPLGPGVTPGRKPRISVVDRLLEADHPDLVLRSTLDPKELKDGFNTLTVVVTTGDSAARVTETVVFHASPVSKARIHLGPYRSPAGPLAPRLTVTPDVLSPALAEVAARGGARRGVRGPLLSAENKPARAMRSVPRPPGDKKKASEAVKERVRSLVEAPVASLAASRERISGYRAVVKHLASERGHAEGPRTQGESAPEPERGEKDYS